MEGAAQSAAPSRLIRGTLPPKIIRQENYCELTVTLQHRKKHVFHETVFVCLKNLFFYNNEARISPH